MSWWLLILVGLNIVDWTISVNGTKINLSFYLRLITFICCCIWG